MANLGDATQIQTGDVFKPVAVLEQYRLHHFERGGDLFRTEVIYRVWIMRDVRLITLIKYLSHRPTYLKLHVRLP